MLGTVLGIVSMLLKMIGCIVLGILGLFFALVLLILFVPVPYRIWAKGDSADRTSFAYRVQVFGLQVIPRKEKKGHRARKSKRQKEDVSTHDTSGAEACVTVVQDNAQVKLPQMSGDATAQQQAIPEPSIPDPKKSTKRSKKPKKQKQAGSMRNVRDLLERIHAEATDEGNRRAVGHVCREIRYLLCHLGPRRVRADVSFSLGDPANTGYATAALSICPFSYGKHTHIIPDFEAEQLYLRGWLDIRGHVRFVHLFISGLRLLLDKDIRKIIRRIIKKK